MNASASASGSHEAERPEAGTFGVDSPKVPAVMGATALLLVILGCVLMIINRFAPGLVTLICAMFFGLCAISYLDTTLHGKFVWCAEQLHDGRQ